MYIPRDSLYGWLWKLSTLMGDGNGHPKEHSTPAIVYRLEILVHIIIYMS